MQYFLVMLICKVLLFVQLIYSVPFFFKDVPAKKIAFQFQCVTWKLEKTLGNLPYDQFDISEEVQEQVGLVTSNGGSDLA